MLGQFTFTTGRLQMFLGTIPGRWWKKWSLSPDEDRPIHVVRISSLIFPSSLRLCGSHCLAKRRIAYSAHSCWPVHPECPLCQAPLAVENVLELVEVMSILLALLICLMQSSSSLPLWFLFSPSTPPCGCCSSPKLHYAYLPWCCWGGYAVVNPHNYLLSTCWNALHSKYYTSG